MEVEKGPEPSREATPEPVFFDRFRDFLRYLPPVRRRYWVLVILTGVAGGLGAAALQQILRLVQRLAWPPGATFLQSVERAPPWMRVVIVAGAGVVVTLVGLASRGTIGGHGTAQVIEAIWRRKGEFGLLRGTIRGLTTIVGVGLGVPLGREGALISSGAGIGSWLGHWARTTADERRVLVACGAAAGIAAAYNVPVGGALFGLEVLLGSFSLELFGPLVVSCVTATVISRMLLEAHATFEIPYYHFGGSWELLGLVVFAPLLGVASAVYVQGIGLLAGLPKWVPRRLAAVLPVPAAAVAGVLSIWWPQILGNGYDSVDDALLGNLPLQLLVVLPFVKLAASSLTAGAGIPGGLFTPSLFFGSLLGGALGVLAHGFWPDAAPIGAYALLGMGAVLAGTTHASISAVIIIFEMTRDYGVILPLLLASVIATAVSRMLSPHSLYTSVLRRRGVPLPEVPRPRWMRERPIKDLIDPAVSRVPPSAPFSEVVVRLLELDPGNDLYVTDRLGHLLGVIILGSRAICPTANCCRWWSRSMSWRRSPGCATTSICWKRASGFPAPIWASCR